MDSSQISSIWTPFWKFIVPPVWSTAFLGLLSLFPSETPRWILILSSIAILSVGFFILWSLFGRFKKVTSDGEKLYISNYIKQIQVPVREIEAAHRVLWGTYWTGVIRLKSHSPFGQNIRVLLPLFSANTTLRNLNTINK